MRLSCNIECSLPEKGYYEKSETCVILFYNVAHEIKTVEYSRMAFLDVLKRHGEDVRKYLILDDTSRLPAQRELHVKVTWSEVKISRELAKKIVVRHELEIAASIMGLTLDSEEIRGKLIPFYSTTNRAA